MIGRFVPQGCSHFNLSVNHEERVAEKGWYMLHMEQA